MKKNKTLIFALLSVLFIISLYCINKDLFHYEYIYPFSRIFTPEENTKGKYLVTDVIPLKTGEYELKFQGVSEGSGNGCYIVDAGDKVIYASDIPVGEITTPYLLDLSGSTSIRIGFSYDPEGGKLAIHRITLEADHVLYKESLLRHCLFSLLITFIFAYIGLRILKPEFTKKVKTHTGIDLPVCEKTFLFLAVLTIAASWPFLDGNRFTEGEDLFFHLSRIEGIAQTLKAGYFPPRILLGWMGNYGVGSGFYYPDMLLFIPAGLCILGISTVNALRIFMILCNFFSMLTMYLAAEHIGSNSKICGAVSAILYGFAAYRFICMYYRNAIGEVQAFIFYPLILWGLVEILRGNTGHWKTFALGFFGLLMSHMISLAIFGVLCALCLLFHIPRIIQDKRIFTAFAKAAWGTILLGAFFLIPMAEQAAKNELEINAVMSNPFVIYPVNLTKFSSIFLPFDRWIHDENFMLFPYPGYSLLLVPLMRLWLFTRKKKDSRMKTTDQMLFAGLFLLAAATDLFPWEYFRFFLSRIQYSWRLLGAASVLLCAAGGIYFDMIFSSARHKKLVISLMFAAAILSGMPILVCTVNEKLVPLENLTLADKIVSGAEYLPPGFDYLFIEQNKDQILYDKSETSISDSKRQKLGFVFSFENKFENNKQNYSLPLIYYYGYQAELTDEAGSTHSIPVTKDDIGLVRINDEAVKAGTIRVSYEKTTLQKISEWISLLTFIVILFKICQKKKRKSS